MRVICYEWTVLVRVYDVVRLTMRVYTGWKGNKCHPFNSRRERLKGPNIYIYI